VRLGRNPGLACGLGECHLGCPARLGPAPTTSPNSATAENAKLQGDPISGALALRDVRQSGGGFVAVSDAELLEAMRVLATVAGVLAEPAGAACLSPHCSGHWSVACWTGGNASLSR